MRSHDYLSPDGLVATSLPGYEHRPQQVDMAEAVEAALNQRKAMLVEAGTGVGKSFAYLLPAVLWSLRTEERVIVSTHTINLQEQLIGKDIPFLRDEVGLSFAAFLAKGRGNYLCLRRLLAATTKGSYYFESFRPDDYQYLDKLETWFYRVNDGTLSSIDFDVPPHVWANVRVEREACSGRRCRYYESCPYFRDRNKWESADILVTNHALFFSDLSLRMGESPLLPGYGAVIFDEAHNLEDCAASHFGISLRRMSALASVRRIFDERSGRGFFNSSGHMGVQSSSMAFSASLTRYFASLSDFLQGGGTRIRVPGRFSNEAYNEGQAFLQELSASISLLNEDSDERIDAQAAFERVKEVVLAIDIFNSMSAEGCVYWVDGRDEDPEFHVIPINVAEKLKEHLWQQDLPFVLTSATLSTGGSKGCKYLSDRLGISEAESKILGSPFDYHSQVKMYIPCDVPEPTKDAGQYRSSLVHYIRGFVHSSQGGTFVLFTNLSDMKYCHDELIDEFTDSGYLVLVQDGSTPRTRMLEMFRSDGRAVLFGVSSFWQGVDVRGTALSDVIIARLPFEVPNHPLVEARREEIAQRGQSDFREYSLPNAILKLKQGFGRLIRTKQDIGRIVILDPRILTKSYGRNFLNALPPCPRITEPDSFNQGT